MIKEKAKHFRLFLCPDQDKIAEKNGVTLREVEDMALAKGILLRYQHNVIGIEDQFSLSKYWVVVVGPS
ncbi:MAG: hypothetical protein PHZ03_04030 [Syntrophomonas sp.]|nr:hypothetical protein [Syntrophomonas sp.]